MTDQPIFFLDLDQTIVHSVEDGEVDGKIVAARKKTLSNHIMPNSIYTVFERPGLQPFLDFLFKNYKVAVWTAASKDYALFVINQCILAGKKDRHLEWILFSYHGDLSRRATGKTKNLEELSKSMGIADASMDRTFIVDDYDEVYYTQPDNCIIAPGFYIEDTESPNDSYLKNLTKRLDNIKGTTSGECKKINNGINPQPRRN